jgi:transposase
VSAPRKYEQEFGDRSVRMYRDRLAEGRRLQVGRPPSRRGLFDLNQTAWRNWVEDAQRSDGTRRPVATLGIDH